MALRKGQRAVGIFDGYAAPTDKDYSALVEEKVIGQVDALHTAEEQQKKFNAAARRIQSVVRMWIHRSRFLLHKSILEGDMNALKAARQTRSAIQLQRQMRGLLHRVRYKALIAAEEAKRVAEQAKKAGKKGKGAAASPPVAAAPVAGQPIPSIRELQLQRNVAFVQGFRCFLKGEYEDALKFLDAQNKIKAEPVIAHLMHRIREKHSVANPGGAAALPSSGATSSKTKPKGGKK